MFSTGKKTLLKKETKMLYCTVHNHFLVVTAHFLKTTAVILVELSLCLHMKFIATAARWKDFPCPYKPICFAQSDIF